MAHGSPRNLVAHRQGVPDRIVAREVWCRLGCWFITLAGSGLSFRPKAAVEKSGREGATRLIRRQMSRLRGAPLDMTNAAKSPHAGTFTAATFLSCASRESAGGVRKVCGRTSPNGVAGEIFCYCSGSSQRLRYSIGAPSLWRQILPEGSEHFVATFCNTPLTSTTTQSSLQTMSY